MPTIAPRRQVSGGHASLCPPYALSSVMRHTSHGKRDTRTEPSITVAALRAGETARTLLARLYGETQRVAS